MHIDAITRLLEKEIDEVINKFTHAIDITEVLVNSIDPRSVKKFGLDHKLERYYETLELILQAQTILREGKLSKVDLVSLNNLMVGLHGSEEPNG